MESNSILDQGLSDEVEITPSVKIALTKSFRWGKTLAITLYIFSGLMILFFLKLATTETRSSVSGGQSFLIAFFLAFIVCTFFSAVNLMGFANRGFLSLKTNNTKILAVCLEHLKNYLKFFGIFVAIIALFFGAFLLLTFLALLT